MSDENLRTVQLAHAVQIAKLVIKSYKVYGEHAVGDSDIKALAQAVLKLSEEKESWGNEYSAVMLAKEEIAKLKEAVRQAGYLIKRLNDFAFNKETLTSDLEFKCERWLEKYGKEIE
jgi:hypothetical protein